MVRISQENLRKIRVKLCVFVKPMFNGFLLTAIHNQPLNCNIFATFRVLNKK